MSYSIFDQAVNQKTLESISQRRVESFSAGETRRLYLLKSLLVNSNIMIIDEPFSNSDERLWEIIYEAININSKSIILSHLSLENFFDFDDNNISINIKKIKKDFLKELKKEDKHLFNAFLNLPLLYLISKSLLFILKRVVEINSFKNYYRN
mgnify:CR=1 FL=1